MTAVIAFEINYC